MPSHHKHAGRELLRGQWAGLEECLLGSLLLLPTASPDRHAPRKGHECGCLLGRLKFFGSAHDSWVPSPGPLQRPCRVSFTECARRELLRHIPYRAFRGSENRSAELAQLMGGKASQAEERRRCTQGGRTQRCMSGCQGAGGASSCRDLYARLWHLGLT